MNKFIQVPIEKPVRDRLKALKGTDTYSQYLDRLMRSGNKEQ